MRTARARSSGIDRKVMETIAEAPKAEGRKRDLTRLLERRFGPLPQDVRDRMATANLDRPDRWLDRLPDARSLDAVFVAG